MAGMNQHARRAAGAVAAGGPKIRRLVEEAQCLPHVRGLGL